MIPRNLPIVKLLVKEHCKSKHARLNCEDFAPRGRTLSSGEKRIVCENCRVILFRWNR